MAIGTMGPGGSNDKAGGHSRISIGSPADCKSSSNLTLSHGKEGRQTAERSQKILDQKHPRDDREERNDQQDDSASSNLSPQSLDEEATCSGTTAPLRDKASNSSSEESRLNDFAQIDHEQREDKPFVWTPYAEVHLLNALRGLRPVGANFNFQINIIHGRFEAGMGTYISREELVKKLYTWYNFDEALRICGGEDIPTNECNFTLPEDEFPECVEPRRQSKAAQKSGADKK